VTEPANRDGFDIAVLMASEFHELKNQLGHLTLVLGDIAAEHPDSAALLTEPRLICQRIAERLVQVLTLYKSGVERLDLNIEAQSPIEFLEEIAAQAAGLAGARLEVTVHADAAPPFWFFDRYLVEMALLNAVHNALQFAREKIELSAAASGDGLVFVVRDDSRGYPSHILDNQGHNLGKHATGTGLGLFFAHTIAEAHENKSRRGRLTLANEDGAVFSLWLP
jgi:signal transduction histidine kinase